MKTNTDVLYEVNDHVAEITINREPYRNAQSRQVLSDSTKFSSKLPKTKTYM